MAAAREAVTRITTRTARGVDAHGRPFAPYSPDYLALRQAAGRGSTVDLTLTGQLLRALRVLRVEPDRVIIGWEGQHRVTRFSAPKTRGKNAGKRTVQRTAGTVSMAAIVLGLNKRREFFAIVLKSEIGMLVAIAQRVIDAEFRRK